MSDQLWMFPPMTSEDTDSATSSPALADGLMPSISPVGVTDLFGQAPVPASPSPPPADKAALLTSGICGLGGFGSSASVALTQSLANRLRERLASAGSIEFQQTWRRKVTPSGRRYWAHTASARRTSDKDFSGWPTPTSRDHKDAASTLENTPVNSLLGRQVQVASWATPRVRDADKGVRTPAAAQKEIARKGPQNELGVVGLVSGLLPSGSPASTARRGASGALNPAFSLWLMGFGIEWLMCAQNGLRKP